MSREEYADQVRFLVRLLPVIATEDIFALKGGTAINLFYRDLPRLSVDIDLTYLPVKERGDSLREIDAAMDRLVQRINSDLPRARAERIQGGGGGPTRALATLGEARIKIETSPVTRGVIHEPEYKAVSDVVTDEFGYAEMQIVAFEDLFGGKLHAAVDRQHPRDLYDVKLLYENEGLTDDLFRTFLVYIASSGRPAHELLNPNLIDLDRRFLNEFSGMTRDTVTLEHLTDTREQLIRDIRARLDKKAANFLLSLHDGNPDFDLIHRPKAADLPAVQWKLLNLNRLRQENPEKHAAQKVQLLQLFR